MKYLIKLHAFLLKSLAATWKECGIDIQPSELHKSVATVLLQTFPLVPQSFFRDGSHGKEVAQQARAMVHAYQTCIHAAVEAWRGAGIEPSPADIQAAASTLFIQAQKADLVPDPEVTMGAEQLHTILAANGSADGGRY